MKAIRLESVKETKNLERFITEQVGYADLPHVIQSISITEINAQKAIKNQPSNIIIDGRRNSSELAINNAKKRVRAFFANPELIAKAASDAHKMLVRATKRKTGKARFSYEFWSAKNYKHEGRSLGSSPSAIRSIALDLPNDGFLRIVGPLVPYGRKLYWGQGQKTKRTYGRKTKRNYNTETGTIDKITAVKGLPGVRSVSTLAIHNDVIRRLRRRYPQLKFTERWVKTSLSAGKTKGKRRFPTISIGYRFIGLIR